MVKRGHPPDATSGDPIPRLGFHSPDGRVPGFEMADLATMYGRMRRRDPGGLHRLEFHTLTLVTGGRGEHMVDFATYPCRPGTLLWVRPGQVQRFGPAGTLKACPYVLEYPSGQLYSQNRPVFARRIQMSPMPRIGPSTRSPSRE